MTIASQHTVSLHCDGEVYEAIQQLKDRAEKAEALNKNLTEQVGELARKLAEADARIFRVMKTKQPYAYYNYSDAVDILNEKEADNHMDSKDNKPTISVDGTDTCHSCDSISGVYLHVCDDCMTEFNKLKARSCEGCKYDDGEYTESDCFYCPRNKNVQDNYEESK